MDRVYLNVGDVVVFTYPFEEQKKKWTVRATSERFVVLTSRGFGADLLYTIIDWDREVRGPVNLIGGGYGIFKHNVMEKSEELINDLHGELVLLHNEDGTPEYSSGVEVSYRNNVPIKIKEVIHKK